MKQIQINNQELTNVLNNISDWFNNFDLTNHVNMRGEPDVDEYYTSQKYFNSIDKEAHDGFGATFSYGLDINDSSNVHRLVVEKRIEIDKALKPILSTPNSAVKMFYPKGGFMHWHNNHNVPGYNILLSYTQNGNGFFRYKDPLTNDTITMHDEPGWTAKVGYYGSNDEPDKIYWHCARAYEDRFTLGYVIPHQEMWQMMCDDIQDH